MEFHTCNLLCAGNPPGQVVVTDIDPDTLGDATTDTGRSSPSVTGLLGYKIEVGRFTEAVLRKSRDIT